MITWRPAAFRLLLTLDSVLDGTFWCREQFPLYVTPAWMAAINLITTTRVLVSARGKNICMISLKPVPITSKKSVPFWIKAILTHKAS